MGYRIADVGFVVWRWIIIRFMFYIKCCFPLKLFFSAVHVKYIEKGDIALLNYYKNFLLKWLYLNAFTHIVGALLGCLLSLVAVACSSQFGIIFNHYFALHWDNHVFPMAFTIFCFLSCLRQKKKQLVEAKSICLKVQILCGWKNYLKLEHFTK